MGFFANMAAKSELKLRDQVLSTFIDFSSEVGIEISTGNVLLPCHIIPEVHNGFYVQYEETTIGVFRCQNHWWLYELDDEVIEGLRSPNSESWLNQLKSHYPVDGGDMAVGIPAFASSILFMLKAHAEEVAENKELEQKQKEVDKESRLRKEDHITQTVNSAAALLWDSGCEMKVRPYQITDPADFPENVVIFELIFQRIRGDWPLYLYANMNADSWFLMDPQVPETDLAKVSPIDTSSKVTAMNILQLIVDHGYTNAHLSSRQKTWAQYIDGQFLPRMTSGIIPELLTQSNKALKTAVTKSLQSIIDSYENFPEEGYSLPALKELKKV